MRPGPDPSSYSSTASTISSLPWRLCPPSPATGSFLLQDGISVSSTSMRPASAARPGATMLRRSLQHASPQVASTNCVTGRRRRSLNRGLSCPFNTIGAGHEVDTVASVASDAARAGAVAPSMAYRGYRLAGLYRWMDRRCFYADEILILGTGLPQYRSAPDPALARPGRGYQPQPSSRLHAAHIAEPAQFGTTDPARRSRHRDPEPRGKRGAAQTLGHRCRGQTNYPEPADSLLSRRGSGVG